MLVSAVLARAGLADSAQAVIERSRGDPILDPTRNLLRIGALVRTILGDQEGAITLLSEYLEVNRSAAEEIATSDYWWFRDLRDHPDFQAFAELVAPARP